MYEQTYKAVPLETGEKEQEKAEKAKEGSEQTGEMNALEEMARRNLSLRFKKLRELAKDEANEGMKKPIIDLTPFRQSMCEKFQMDARYDAKDIFRFLYQQL